MHVGHADDATAGCIGDPDVVAHLVALFADDESLKVVVWERKQGPKARNRYMGKRGFVRCTTRDAISDSKNRLL